MPRIFDNIEQRLLPALTQTLEVAERADFCVGYFNLRGWRALDSRVERWAGGEGHCCRLLVGMQRLPHDDLRSAKGFSGEGRLDNAAALRLKKRLAEEFREQLTIGAPTNEDEAGLRRLARQIKSGKVVVKLFLRHTLHAKLYLLFRPDPINPCAAYLGSSNLTLPGLSHQGELNVDVLDHDACGKLAAWFEERWRDRLCIDISDELARIVEESWAREEPIPPYRIFIKMAYHLSQEARAGLNEFRIPKDLSDKLLDFQEAAVKIAAHHLNKRGGVIVGDVVGLGKTLMATALARVFEDDHGLQTLIVCPKNLVPMWRDYRERYGLRGRVLSISRVTRELPAMRRYRLVVIDESHNLRNREGRRYRALREYIRENDSKCILLSATPYNKTYDDLAGQLGLFLREDEDLGIRPERLLREMGETEFVRLHQAPVNSLAAFEQSAHADDWRELMRLYLVRRTRSFIQSNYAAADAENGRKYLTFADGSRSYFPDRVPRTVRLDADAQYARLFSDEVVGAVNGLRLPRYGLGNYAAEAPRKPPAPAEAKILEDLSRAGKRLMGFCRTNLFKRLESSGSAFLLSVERHVLRNFVFLHAIENGLPLPIGSLDADLLDAASSDADAESGLGGAFDEDGGQRDAAASASGPAPLRAEQDFRERAAAVYASYAGAYKRRFRWLRADLFTADLRRDLAADADDLRNLLAGFGDWRPAADAKLNALHRLLARTHAERKVLVFTQFADTVRYLQEQLTARGLTRMAAVTGDTADPAAAARRFSPQSNAAAVPADKETRVLIATDVLSEGQNLQDCAIVINYDLPWAIIRLIQRAGRVDRIGQQSAEIVCYSFLPADGVERLIRLRSRVRERLDENAEVMGTDEAFFEDEDQRAVLDLYNERAGVLDGDDDAEIDLSSYAYQIWKNAVVRDPSLKKEIEDMPAVVYSAKAWRPQANRPEGALVYLRTAQGSDALAWMSAAGGGATESWFEILRAAACPPDEPALPRGAAHHDLVRRAAQRIARGEKQVGGQLGRPSGARFRAYERLKRYAREVEDTLFDTEPLRRTVDAIYRYPLRQAAADALNRQLRSGISDEALAELAVTLRDEGRLSIADEEDERREPQIVCSLGLIDTQKKREGN